VKSLLERTHRRPIKPQRMDINAMVRELLLLVEPIFQSRGIQCSVQLDEDLPRVSADRESLHQVFLNLVNNSIEAKPGGGEFQIITDYLPRPGVIQIRFVDSGVGICPDAREHLFEPMWTTKQSGGGLGLVIAREIMTEHRGEIACVNGLVQGAEFRLTLPVVESIAAAVPHSEVRMDAA
ncbi:MAG: sensor histidine kinase, partial [Pyrinomonadaceae bacterium]